MSRTAQIKIAAVKHLVLCAIWSVLPRVAKGAIYKYHRQHRKLLAN